METCARDFWGPGRPLTDDEGGGWGGIDVLAVRALVRELKTGAVGPPAPMELIS